MEEFAVWSMEEVITQLWSVWLVEFYVTADAALLSS
jgi:hypothetical protein